MTWSRPRWALALWPSSIAGIGDPRTVGDNNAYRRVHFWWRVHSVWVGWLVAWQWPSTLFGPFSHAGNCFFRVSVVLARLPHKPHLLADGRHEAQTRHAASPRSSKNCTSFSRTIRSRSLKTALLFSRLICHKVPFRNVPTGPQKSDGPTSPLLFMIASSFLASFSGFRESVVRS